MTEPPWYQSVGVPGLMRAARGAYSSVIHAALVEADFEDLPRNGAFVLAWLAHAGSLRDISRWLGISKQAVSQLIDTMVMRGYLERAVDQADRRRMRVTLTERGKAAESIVADAADQIDAELEDRLGSDGLAALRTGLITLADLRAGRPEHQ
jgi:DNA-binding MarR family transcriptional regulator